MVFTEFEPTHPFILVLGASAMLGQAAVAQSGLSGGRSRTSPNGVPEFQLGIVGSGSAASEERGAGYFAGLRLPIRRWLYAQAELGHVYRISGVNADQGELAAPPSVGPFARTFTEPTEVLPLPLPTGFFAARLSGQIPIGNGANLRPQLGARRRNASHLWLPTAGLAIQFPSRSTPVIVELEAARYRVPYRDVQENFLDGVLVTRTDGPSSLTPARGLELSVRVGLAFGPAQRGRRR